MKPSPAVAPGGTNWPRPSTKISSPAVNGGVVNPKVGVCKVAVTLPFTELYSNLLICIPLLLLRATILCSNEVKPCAGSIILTLVKALASITADTNPLST